MCSEKMYDSQAMAGKGSSKRVQVILSEDDVALFQESARKQGQSLSAWLRQAGRERLDRIEQTARFETADEVRSFFDRCDAEPDSADREPDWEQHERVIAESKTNGLTRS